MCFIKQFFCLFLYKQQIKKMELQYVKAMQEHELSFEDLPEDAQTGIEQIKDIQKAFLMLERRGKKPTDKALKKVKAMDKWVYYEILDFINETDENENEIPHEKKEVIEEINKDMEKDETIEKVEEIQTNADPKGLLIDNELEKLIVTKSKWTIDELETAAPQTYNVLFEAYEPEDENGIETSKFTLIEEGDYTFTLKRK